MPTWSQSLKHFFTANSGEPLVGGLLYTYAAGTTTPKAAFKDSLFSVPHTNPIVLDSRGEELIYWNGSYKVVLTYPSKKKIWTVDGVSGSGITVSVPDTVELPPIANFTYTPASPVAPAVITATSTSTRLTGADSFLWTVDGVTHAVTANTFFSLTTAGSHTVALKVSNEFGESTKTVTIGVAQPGSPVVLDISWTPTSGLTTATSINFAYVALGSPTSQFWAFWLDDVQVGSSTSVAPSFTFTSPGAARVTLTVVGASGTSPEYGEDIGTIAPAGSVPGNALLTNEAGAGLTVNEAGDYLLIN